MDSEQDYVKLLDLLVRVIEANKGSFTGDDDRFWYAEGLATKLFLHAASVLYLSRGTKIADFPSAPLKFPDPASIDVLARAALETFLTFHYIFVEPETDEEKDYRYWAWKAAGLTERQNHPVSIEAHKQKLAGEKKEIDDLHSKLRSNIIFQQLTGKQQEQVLKKGKWKLLSWREIAEEASLARILSSDMYRHLSGYAHSSWLSVLQIKQSLEDKEESLLIEPSMKTIAIATANFIREYCNLFPKTKDVLAADAEGTNIVDEWIQIGQALNVEKPLQDEAKNHNR